jgi:hypothetical protein
MEATESESQPMIDGLRDEATRLDDMVSIYQATMSELECRFAAFLVKHADDPGGRRGIRLA